MFNLRLSILATCLVSLPILGHAQSRAIGAGSLIVDDGNGHSITIQAPTGLSSSTYSWQLPMPPSGPAQQSGFVPVGSITGQTLMWDGTQWSASSALTNTGSQLGFTTSLLPGTDNTLNIGDASHRINTLYVSNLVGPSLGTNYFQRVGTTLSPVTSGDNLNTTGQLQLQSSGGGITSFAAASGEGATNISYTLPTAQGSSLSSLTNDGSGNLSWTNRTLFARKTVEQAVNVLTDDNALTVAGVANQTYVLDGLLYVSDTNATTVYATVSFTLPAGASIRYAALSTASSQQINVNISTNTISNIPIGAIGTNMSAILLKGTIIMGANSGNIVLREGSSSSINKMSVWPNSFIQLTRVQ